MSDIERESERSEDMAEYLGIRLYISIPSSFDAESPPHAAMSRPRIVPNRRLYSEFGVPLPDFAHCRTVIMAKSRISSSIISRV